MKKRKTLESMITTRIARKKCAVFLRSDFDDLGGYDQVGRVLRDLVSKNLLMKIGYGLYAKTRQSTLTGQIIPNKPLPQLAKEALKRLGVKTAPSSIERDYNAGRSTQIPTGRMIAVKGRVIRRIGYNGAYVNFEYTT